MDECEVNYSGWMREVSIVTSRSPMSEEWGAQWRTTTTIRRILLIIKQIELMIIIIATIVNYKKIKNVICLVIICFIILYIVVNYILVFAKRWWVGAVVFWENDIFLTNPTTQMHILTVGCEITLLIIQKIVV